MQQVILNLIINALESMSGLIPADLVVSSGKDGSDSVRVSVLDWGEGLMEGTLDRLFEAFYTTKPNGMGMGLAISRSIISDHGGRLWATPNVRAGPFFSSPCPPKPRHMNDTLLVLNNVACDLGRVVATLGEQLISVSLPVRRKLSVPNWSGCKKRVCELREAFPYDTTPHHLVFDRDAIFSAQVVSIIESLGSLSSIATPSWVLGSRACSKPLAPWSFAPRSGPRT